MEEGNKKEKPQKISSVGPKVVAGRGKKQNWPKKLVFFCMA